MMIAQMHRTASLEVSDIADNIIKINSVIAYNLTLTGSTNRITIKR